VPPSDFAGAVAGLSDFSDFSDDLSDFSGVPEEVPAEDFSALSAFFRDSEG
jgi:hypothetical protein